MSSYLKAYLNTIEKRGQNDLAASIKMTASEFAGHCLDSFSFADHEMGLLFGNVQAGKTAQMFGIICAAADASFPIFIILTTDSVALQSQTFERVMADLSDAGFCICGELDKQKFIDNELSEPAIIVLKKNSKVLLQWYNTLASSSFVKGNSLFVVDDEADAASPNTLVNKGRVSTINSRLSKIRNSSIGSLYLQVTGTPQALLLQSTMPNFRPSFTCYFAPGKGYLGGEFFFGDDKTHIRFIDSFDSELKDGLYDAIIHHLCATAQLYLAGETVCNFVIHPGVRKSSHISMATNTKKRLQYISDNLLADDVGSDIKRVLDKMSPKKIAKHSFEETIACIQTLFDESRINVLVMNGDTSVREEEYTVGSNIVIGGNVLGRGVTFPKLQTLYYSRTAKKPQADTMWQHSRMFGYDRDPGLMAVYLTKHLYKLFSNINEGNNSIISQVEHGIEKIQLFYPDGINPTRKNVIDLKMVDLLAGGANYYPDDPENNTVDEINELLQSFGNSDYCHVSLKMILQVLSHVIPSDDFDLDAFIDVIRAILADKPTQQAILIVRRGRAVTQGTGSLLSPNDRALGAQFMDEVVLTMYQIEGNMGWKQPNIWIPNIKLPEYVNYYNVK